MGGDVMKKYRLASECMNKFDFLTLKVSRRIREFLAKREDKITRKYNADFCCWKDWNKKDFELID